MWFLIDLRVHGELVIRITDMEMLTPLQGKLPFR